LPSQIAIWPDADGAGVTDGEAVSKATIVPVGVGATLAVGGTKVEIVAVTTWTVGGALSGGGVEAQATTTKPPAKNPNQRPIPSIRGS
jgi:hypothetical protein